MPVTVPSTACTVLSHHDRLTKSNRSNQTRSSASQRQRMSSPANHIFLKRLPAQHFCCW